MTYLLWAAALVLLVLCLLAHAGLFDIETDEQSWPNEKDEAAWPHITSTGQFGYSPISDPIASPRPHPTQPWEIRASPGRGLGIFATRNIARGETILAERPLFSIGVPESPVPVPAARTLKGRANNTARSHIAPTPLSVISAAVAIGFNALGAEQRVAYLACYEHCFAGEVAAGGRDASGVDVGGRVLRIFRSNAYAFEIDVGASETGEEVVSKWRWGMYLLMSSFNHSCCPNVGSSGLDDGKAAGDGLKTVKAYRDIVAGEELFVSYVNLLQDTSARRAGLRQFGFVCRCSACHWHDASMERGLGDERRAEAGRLLGELEETADGASASYLSPPDGQRYEHKARRLVDLIDLEGLADYLPRAYGLLDRFSLPASRVRDPSEDPGVAWPEE